MVRWQRAVGAVVGLVVLVAVFAGLLVSALVILLRLGRLHDTNRPHTTSDPLEDD